MYYDIYDVSTFLYSQKTTTQSIRNGVNMSGLSKLFYRLYKNEHSRHILVFDPPKGKRVYPPNDTYKANRDGKPIEVSIMEDFIKKFSKELRITVLTADNVEADDLIYSITDVLSKKENGIHHVTIHSSDRDITACLLSDNVSIIPVNPNYATKLTKENYSSAIIRDFYLPYNMIGFYTLCYGKNSDNIPPVKNPKEMFFKAYSALEKYLDKLPKVLENNVLRNLSTFSGMKSIIEKMELDESQKKELLEKAENIGMEIVEVENRLNNLPPSLDIQAINTVLVSLNSRIHSNIYGIDTELLDKLNKYWDDSIQNISSPMHSTAYANPEVNSELIEDLF